MRQGRKVKVIEFLSLFSLPVSTEMSSKDKNGHQKDKREDEPERKRQQQEKIPYKPIASAASILSKFNRTISAVAEAIPSSSLMQALLRLSVSLYLVNYTFIRFDYFSSRVYNELVPNTIHVLSKRLIYTFTLTIAASYAFHIVIFAPFDSLRRHFSVSAVKRT